MKKFMFALVMMLALIGAGSVVAADTYDEGEYLYLPDREFVELAVDYVFAEVFDISEILEQHGFGRVDFVQYIYRGATEPETVIAFWQEFGEYWLLAMIEITIADLVNISLESPEMLEVALVGIFEWAWTPEEVSAFVGADYLGARFAIDLNRSTRGLIESEIFGAKLNLFVLNNDEQSIVFVFQLMDADFERVDHMLVEIAPGDDFVIQLPYSVVEGHFVLFELIGTYSWDINAHLAFRYTHLPLGYE